MRRFVLICALVASAPVAVTLMPGHAVAAKGDGDHPAVTELSANTFQIDKATFDKYANDLNKAAKLANAEPNHGKNGVNGWVLSGISKGSLPHAAGLHNGDRVTTVNGKALKGMPGVVLTLESLRGQKNYTVKVVRRDGRKVTFKYRIR